jgi:ABC-type transporter Mla subunit MlaD
MLRDPDGRDRLQRTLDELAAAAAAVNAVGHDLSSGNGTLGKLIGDEEYAKEFLADLHALTASLRRVSEKLDSGEGSAGRFLNDPQLYEDLENVIRGVQESRTMRWLIQNRRAAGEQIPAEQPVKEVQQ